MISAVLHGAGRFALHFLHDWLQRPGAVRIVGMHDMVLTAKQVVDAIQCDRKGLFAGWAIRHLDGSLVFERQASSGSDENTLVSIPFSCGAVNAIPCLNEADIFLECSGYYSQNIQALLPLPDKIRHVLVSATCPGADQTLIMGFNHTAFCHDAKVISYGSCTVNAFVPLAEWFQRHFGMLEADVSVVHNVPEHKLSECTEPRRVACSLSVMAPRLLPFLSDRNFWVRYVLVPYTGVSLIDFRFRAEGLLDAAEVQDALLKACAANGELHAMYELFHENRGAAAAALSPASAVLLTGDMRVSQNDVLIPAYFDNENSAVRYHEIVQYVASRIDLPLPPTSQ